ncbi:hypothetical protein KQH60_11815 [Mycetohabitans sp. B8]|nr:hypothetical protein [Mycetohabitans sp. B8]
MTGYPVVTIEQEVETALGAAWLAGLGAGCGCATTRWVAGLRCARAVPDPARRACYVQLLGVYSSLCPSLRGAMPRLCDIG